MNLNEWTALSAEAMTIKDAIAANGVYGVRYLDKHQNPRTAMLLPSTRAGMTRYLRQVLQEIETKLALADGGEA